MNEPPDPNQCAVCGDETKFFYEKQPDMPCCGKKKCIEFLANKLLELWEEFRVPSSLHRVPMTSDQARRKHQRACLEALGFIELAKMSKAAGGDGDAMRKLAIEALEKFTNDDEAIDAIYDSQCGEQKS